MATLKSEAWVCLECGRTNYYGQHSCIQCGADRVQASDLEPAYEKAAHRSVLDEARVSQQRTRKRYVFLALACLSFFAWATLLTEYRKWAADWGGFPVLLVAVFAAAIMSIWLIRKRWFTDQNRSTRWRFMIIPAVAFILCAAAGIHFTEPSQARTGGAINRRSPDYQYDHNLSRTGGFDMLALGLDFGSGAADADADEGCMLLLLVLAAIMFILGSIFVPHFWVLSTLLMNVAMLLLTFREWRIVAPDADM
jgi:hypothetical protein